MSFEPQGGVFVFHDRPLRVCKGRDERGCGYVLTYECTVRGIEYWRCPVCGNAHWWRTNEAQQ